MFDDSHRGVESMCVCVCVCEGGIEMKYETE